MKEGLCKIVLPLLPTSSVIDYLFFPAQRRKNKFVPLWRCYIPHVSSGGRRGRRDFTPEVPATNDGLHFAQALPIIKTGLLKFVLSLLILTTSLLHLQAAIYVDSTRTTPSNCANDGVINIYAHSNTSLLYTLISGPDIRPAQSGSSFSGLQSGFYVVMVTDFANDTVNVAATVEGNYTFPDFSPSFSNPRCSGSADGIIVGNSTQGRAPFTWVLTNTGNGAVVTQASDSFLNLPAGNYNLRQYDTCFNFATYSVSLADPFDSFNLIQPTNLIFKCDSVRLNLEMFIYNGAYFYPYTIQIQTLNGSYQHIITNLNGNQADWYPTFTEDVGGVSYGDYINVTITDGCGKSVHAYNTVSPFHIYNILTSVTDSCRFGFRADFYLDQGNLSYMPAPVSVVATDLTTGAVNSIINNDSVNHCVYMALSPFLQPGHSYNIKLTDGCGNVFTQNYIIPNVDTPLTYRNVSNLGCLDSVASIGITWQNIFTSMPALTLLSGPGLIHSTKRYFQYTDSILYPLSLPCFGGVNGYFIQLTNLGAGTYHYIVADSCGHSVTDSFTILPSDLSDHTFRASYAKGCPGQNKIMVDEGNLSSTIILTGNLPNQTTFTYVYPYPDTISNLNYGMYVLNLTFGVPGGSQVVSAHLSCLTALDTIVIPPYQLPQIAYATEIKCNGTVNVGLLPDSSKGIAPYSYQILSGPQTYSNQSSNFFTFTLPGIYVARISDTCGFAQTFTFSVDTLSFQQVVKVGSSCLGEGVTLQSQSSPYATYTWHKPNGSYFTGDSLIINPVTVADYGVYTITKYVNVNNCHDTVNSTYTLTSSSITNITAAVCNGHGVQFAGHTYTAPGVYSDTIQTALCDSVVTLTITTGFPVYTSEVQTICAGQNYNFNGRILTTHGIYRDTLQTTNGCDSIHALDLLVNDMPYDSAAISLCNGQSITVGSHTYNTTGIYYDTLTTSSGCDSVYVLNLTVGGMKYDTATISLCSGQSIIVGAHTYNTSGIFRDTLTSAGGCDSVHVLNLTVGSLKYDSAATSICNGQSITIGTHTYNTTGIYRDTFATAGCDSVHVLNLTVGSLKYDSAALSICSGQSITLGTQTYNTTGIYRDTFTTAGCDSVYVLNLRVVNFKYDSSAQRICSGQSITVGTHTYSATGIYRDTLISSGGCDSIYVLNLTTTATKYDTITIGFCTGDSVVINGLTYKASGLFNDTLSTTGCDSIVTVSVEVYTKPVVQISASSTQAISGDTIQLNATGSAGLLYNWSSSGTLSDAHLTNPLLTVYQSAWVILTAGNSNNCTTADSLYITVDDCSGSIFAPNVFTPNNDGHNDTYRVYSNCAIIKRLCIFNRWGEKVFETTNIDQGWDGTYQGTPQPPSVYVYYLEYYNNTGTTGQVKQLKGSITLLR